METNIFDLTGKEQFYCVEVDKETIRIKRKEELRTLLIYPRNHDANKLPYLQDYDFPILDDFYAQDGSLNFSNSYFLHDFLYGYLDFDKRQKLQDYFNYQLGVLADYRSEGMTILLIPDDYDSEKQEWLLRSCGLPRDQTLLLWRSVAICLGAEERLKDAGVKQGNTIAVVDGQSSGKVNISLLTMQLDGNQLVPARSSFNRKEKYPVVNGDSTTLELSLLALFSKHNEQKMNDFWRHTWHYAGKFYVPDDDNWKIVSFSKESRYYQNALSREVMQIIDFFIVTGDIEIDFHSIVKQQKVIHEPIGNNFSEIGAARFSYRNQEGLPTYYDECEPLYFIVQDLDNERIVPKELIKGNEFCRGGRKIDGEVNKNFVLGKDNDSVSFVLHMGSISEDTHLRELTQTFNCSATVNQPLTLYPSMIPGQGIARVDVEAYPLLREKVELDFTKMSFAYDKENNNAKKTIRYLQENMPRSYPVDMPEVESSENLWIKNCKMEVKEFMLLDKPLKANCFYKCRWPYRDKGGIEAFRRENVFGTLEGSEYPDLNICYFKEVFEKIARRIICGDNSYIRLAAWTYRCGIDEFQFLVDRVMQKVKYAAAGDNLKANGIKTEEFSVCANMMSANEQVQYIRYFIKFAEMRLAVAGDNAKVEKISQWLRALWSILMYSNELLKDVTIEECNQCMCILIKIVRNGVKFLEDDYYRKKDFNIARALCSMLFLLRKRKYARGYLQDTQDDVYMDLMSFKQEHLVSHLTEQERSIFRVFFEHLDNKGSLNLPLGGLLNDKD